MDSPLLRTLGGFRRDARREWPEDLRQQVRIRRFAHPHRAQLAPTPVEPTRPDEIASSARSPARS
jgi:hypothetical protein